MPYQKYGYWYLPNCDIQFESDTEAKKYARENGISY